MKRAVTVGDIVFRLLEGHRAGTRPAPTGPSGGKLCSGLWRRSGQTQGLPLQDRLGGIYAPACGGVQGRHKACPYRTVWGGELCSGLWRRSGQAQGLPLPDCLGGNYAPAFGGEQGRHKACPYRTVWGEFMLPLVEAFRAGTRPDPTGPSGGELCSGLWRRSGQAQGLPLPDCLGGNYAPACRGVQDRHKACPYRTVWGEFMLPLVEAFRAGTRPDPTGPSGGELCSGLWRRSGQAQGLPLPDCLGGNYAPARGGVQGRHKACPYRTVWGEYCWPDTLLGKIKHGRQAGREPSMDYLCALPRRLRLRPSVQTRLR